MEELQSRAFSPAEVDALRHAATAVARYDVLGQRVFLAGDAPQLIERFDALYDAFRLPDGAATDREILFHHSAPGEPFRWVLWADGEGCEVLDPAIAEWPSMVFARLILQRLDTHYLVHAGCVARDGGAVVVSGASGLGKSTLTAHLAAAGWSLLSDEFAPIRRRSLTVDPYPLRVGLRVGPGRALSEGQDFIPLQFRNEDKHLVSVHQLSRGSPPAPAALRAVIFLTTELTADVLTARRHRGTVRCWFTSWPAPLAPALRERFGIEVRSSGTEGTLAWADLVTGDLTDQLGALRDCAREHGTVLAMVEYEDFGEKNYADPPRLLRLPVTAGLVELVKRMPSHTRNALIASAFAGKAAGLMFELAGALAGVRFYKMTPGRLADELAAVENIWQGHEPSA